ncbi:MAG: prepilin-type N-terminal cleavage/methylation domain-containing protein [Clostridiaceae bacterium]|nr:prepilin-type N-terminal cleavage/methylation domain-containing protein [Clostridiaceae bacterium]
MRKIGQKGTTLTELLVSIAILCIIMSPVYLVINTGYRYYFIENDNMLAKESSRIIMEKIIEDLRMYENEYTEAADPNGYILVIKDAGYFPENELIYTYFKDLKVLKRNGINVLDNPQVEVVAFSAVQEIQNYDSWIIEIGISVRTGKSDVINLQSSYRTKVKLLP